MARFRRFSFALCLFYHFSGPSTKPNPPSHFPRTNYSFKVVFRVFRDFHSVPVKTLICSNWNIQPEHFVRTMFQSEHQPVASVRGVP